MPYNLLLKDVSKKVTDPKTNQISALRPYPSPLITSGAIQYGVPTTEWRPVALTMVWSRLEAPKSPSFMFPLPSRSMLAPTKTHNLMNYLSHFISICINKIMTLMNIDLIYSSLCTSADTNIYGKYLS